MRGVSEKGVEDERESGEMSFGAGGKNGPHPFPTGSALRAACALRGDAVNHDLADGLFRPVVGRLDQGIGKESLGKCQLLAEKISRHEKIQQM
jgi:hypothetical protein